MKDYLANIWFKVGLGLAIIGWGPLLAIILLAVIGLWPDPNPNPIGPGLLFFFTFWPAVACLAIGTLQTRRKQKKANSTSRPSSRGPNSI